MKRTRDKHMVSVVILLQRELSRRDETNVSVQLLEIRNSEWLLLNFSVFLNWYYVAYIKDRILKFFLLFNNYDFYADEIFDF